MVELSVRTSLIWQWAQIAVKHESAALESRARGDLDEELQGSMVCIAAVAFALDAMYGEQREVVPEAELEAWRGSGTARWKRIYRTLDCAFKLPGSFRDELQWLFGPQELGRDFLVHADAKFRDAADHPLLQNTTAERSRLRAENATRAVDLMMHVLDASLAANTPAAVEWARVNTGVIELVRALRGSHGG